MGWKAILSMFVSGRASTTALSCQVERSRDLLFCTITILLNFWPLDKACAYLRLGSSAAQDRLVETLLSAIIFIFRMAFISTFRQ